MRACKNNIVGSVGIFKRTPGLLKTLRKEVFKREHRKRKEYSLRCSGRLREKPSKNLAEIKEGTEETVSTSYKLRREREKLPKGNDNVH